MDPGILTTTLQHFLTVFSQGWSNLQPAIGYLIMVFLGIEIVMFGLWIALGGLDNLAGIMKKLLYLMIWLWIVQNFPMLADAFVRSLVMAGQMASGGSGGNIFNPSNILRIGFNTTAPLVQEMSQMNMLIDFTNAIIMAVSYVMIMLAYLLISWQIFYAVLEFYLISALVGLFLPFGFVEQTKFLAEKAVGAVISSGIKLMVLAFIVAIIEPVLATLSFSGNLTLTEIWSILLTVGALAFLCWNAPGVAAGLMAGSPSLTAGTALQNAVVAGGAAAVGAWGAVKAGGAAFQATRAAATAGLNSQAVQTAALASSPGSSRVANSATGGGFGGGGGKTPGEGITGVVGSTPSSGGTSADSSESKSSDWAKQALHAAHKTPEEARPAGGSAQPRL